MPTRATRHRTFDRTQQPGENWKAAAPCWASVSGAVYSSLVLELVPGSRLFVCTDGVTETFDSQGRFWGTCELVAMLESTRSEDPSRVVERILERLMWFRGDKPQEDDLTLMVAGLPPAGAEAEGVTS